MAIARTHDNSTAIDHDIATINARLHPIYSALIDDTKRNPRRWKRVYQLIDRTARFAGTPACFAR
jgi:hypothetical protein